MTTTTDFIVTQTSKGTRLHRATCKRAGEGHPLAEVKADPALLAEAKLASCCRPGAAAAEQIALAQEAVLATAALAQADDVTVEPPEQASSEADKPAVAQPTVQDVPAPEKASKAGPYSREVLMSEAKIRKHYWKAFGVDGGTAIAKAAAAVEVQANNKAQSLIITGKKRDVERAAKVLVETWVRGFAAFNVWRRADEAYKALPSQDTHWATSERYATEQAWLRSYAQKL